ncbi:hypothetical protein CO731_04835 [Aminobacter sp. MSH1]|uniref:hypothetical protein n=1 Tax=Aminobacter sp. MSH1 TaxID=374606 RepID=UPI000D38E958|nr:hypothetical protein [Aminobacter sp. MSH1]AWC25340.1 hypothetical protein CO731_04835 [Aminobacter sp. MSH1]
MDIVNKEIPLNSFTVSIGSVRKIFRGLQRIVTEEADLKLAQWVLLPDQTQEEFDARKKEVREKAFNVTVSMYRQDGSHTYGNSEDIFELSGSAPAVTRIFMTNMTAYRGMANVDPANSFQVLLDFSQPPLLDANNIVSSPTPNVSSLTIGSERDGWLAGIERVVLSNIDRKHKFRQRFHGPFIYDYGLFVLGIPFALYVCWLLSDYVGQVSAGKSQFLSIAAFVYIVFASLWCYRILFGYTKWAFPVAELQEQTSNPKIHRKFWWGIVAIIFGKIFWDYFDPYLSISSWIGSGVGQ